MGTDYYAYVGPVLVVDLVACPQPLQAVEQCLVCKNDPKVTKYDIVPTAGEKKFCHKCGGALKDYKLSEMAIPDVDIYDLFDDALAEMFSEYRPSSIKKVFIPNKRVSKNIRRMNFDVGSECAFQELSPPTIDDEIDWFSTTYEPEIAKLKEICGIGNVTVSWGFGNWAS